MFFNREKHHTKQAADEQQARRLVTGVYRGVLHREPSETEVTHWVHRLSIDLAPADMVDEFLRSEEFRKQDLHAPVGDFYSPIVDPAEAARYFQLLESAGTPASLPGIALDREAMKQMWMTLLPAMRSAPFRELPGNGFRYGFTNEAYEWGDGLVLHAMIRHYRPRKIIEIGSGWSTVCIADTIKHSLNGECELTCIEPYPDLARSLLVSLATEQIQILETPVQQVPLSSFILAPNDILFIDSTHVLRTGSDVCRELCEILPSLTPGVIVHLHDMFWPFEYPRKWVVDENRSWNELYAVRLMLTHSRDWKILMFNDYMSKLERPFIEQTCSDFLKIPCGGLWLERQ